jgi:hypothetical protein
MSPNSQLDACILEAEEGINVIIQPVMYPKHLSPTHITLGNTTWHNFFQTEWKLFMKQTHDY